MTTKDAPGEPADPPTANDFTRDPSGTTASAVDRPANDPALSEQLLGLTVGHPAVGVCVVTVDGELDMATTPLLEACLRDQLATGPTHLILDLQPVRFMASNGLNCLLHAHELAQTTGVRLHLAGLITRAVARPLEITQLLERFNTYPTLSHALTALTN
ncbi:MAG: STAS domain-containing protein [Actinobacteria bacterium]|nr:STAS domain-containing protein [Actinomycetota bacterium]